MKTLQMTYPTRTDIQENPPTPPPSSTNSNASNAPGHRNDATVNKVSVGQALGNSGFEATPLTKIERGWGWTVGSNTTCGARSTVDVTDVDSGDHRHSKVSINSYRTASMAKSNGRWLDMVDLCFSDCWAIITLYFSVPRFIYVFYIYLINM